MSKARRAPDQNGSSASSSAEAEVKAQQGTSNELITTLIREAGVQAGIDESTTILSLSGGDSSKLGKYDFAENHDDGRYQWAGDDEERKTQVDPLPELREKHEGSNYKDFETGKAFVKGATDEHEVDPNDVKQGSLGDCYLMAGMLAVARANPEAIKDIINDRGDGTFDVTLYIRESYYSTPVKVTKTIDARLPVKSGDTPLYAKTGDKTEDNTELWPALIEKAVAQQKGSYELISGGNISKGFEFHGATELLTGKREGYIPLAAMDSDIALLQIAYALEGKKPCTVDSRNMEDDQEMATEAKKFNVYGNHAYVPRSVDLDGETITLDNPWGSHHVENLPIKDFMRFYRSIRIGA